MHLMPDSQELGLVSSGIEGSLGIQLVNRFVEDEPERA